MNQTLPIVLIVPALFAGSLAGCYARAPIDPDRNQLSQGEREGHGDNQLRWLARDQTRAIREPWRVRAYASMMEERLSPRPIEGELVFGQVWESFAAWERLVNGEPKSDTRPIDLDSKYQRMYESEY